VTRQTTRRSLLAALSTIGLAGCTGSGSECPTKQRLTEYDVTRPLYTGDSISYESFCCTFVLTVTDVGDDTFAVSHERQVEGFEPVQRSQLPYEQVNRVNAVGVIGIPSDDGVIVLANHDPGWMQEKYRAYQSCQTGP